MTLCLFLAATLIGSAPASAEGDFPNRPVRIVVPFPAGGPTDVNIRILGQKLSEMWGQSVVIENRPGANTGIGAQLVANAPADGTTLLAAMDTTLVMNPATGASMNYDPFKDFAAITLTAKNTSLLTVRASDGPKTIQELIARGKASKTKLNYGAGIIITRLAGATFAKAAGIDVVLVPYKGSSEVVQGLLTGSVDFIVDGIAPSLPLIKSGQFRPLAKLNDRPLPALPDLKPLAVAANLPQIGEMSSWIGLVAPAGTPSAIVQKIQQDVVKAYADPVVADRLEKAGITAVTTTPAEFDAFFRSEAQRWTKIYKDSGIKLN
ncbi:MAG TPA: tripartite tricarboxylate transporter substrate-binding protein [Xanthobacteraceae bacterium]|nr:tripartite tricarboxylate transporter substrate-binding protein [Xanthobacteraceae bacterium]